MLRASWYRRRRRVGDVHVWRRGATVRITHHPSTSAPRWLFAHAQAYHGSHATNWYSILSNGLQNLSGTEHQVTGN